MEFIRKLFNRNAKGKEEDQARGVAPVQSQEEQDASRERMEAEVNEARERREANQNKE